MTRPFMIASFGLHVAYRFRRTRCIAAVRSWCALTEGENSTTLSTVMPGFSSSSASRTTEVPAESPIRSSDEVGSVSRCFSIRRANRLAIGRLLALTM